jgi:pSer/pThr/pTyr-binding forkhead associated (FHA) protein
MENNKNIVNIEGNVGMINGIVNGRKDFIKKNKRKNEERLDELVLEVDLEVKSKYTFGRRKENDFQRDDKHMSGMHCKITYFN